MTWRAIHAFVDWLLGPALLLGCLLSAAVVILAVVMNISYHAQWVDIRLTALEEGREAPEYVHQFCTQPRDRNKRQPLWWVLPRCWDVDA